MSHNCLLNLDACKEVGLVMDTFPRIGMVKKLAGEVERVKWRGWQG